MDNGQRGSKKKSSTRRAHRPVECSTPARITRRALDALLPFGLIPIRSDDEDTHRRALDPDLVNRIERSSITLITGCSGSGKSTMLQQIREQLPRTVHADDLDEPDPSVPILNLFTGSLETTMSLLSATGLGEPKLWTLPARALSTGEQARLDLARLIDASDPGTMIVIDEFAMPLDRLTARALCATLRRLVDRMGLRIIVAGAHEDLTEFLHADLVIHAQNQSAHDGNPCEEQVEIVPGSIEDYHALKRHHYIGSDPANPCLYLRADRRCPVTRDRVLAGVLVMSHPTINGSWRSRAWPGRYNSGDKRKDASMINAEIRSIARIIIDPRSRGLGIATRLVNAYLSNPLSPCTEAIAAMGSVMPFFKRAGMTAYPMIPTRHDARLLDALEHAGFTPHDVLSEALGDPFIVRELRTWARVRKIDLEAHTLDTIGTLAAVRLLSKPVAFTHTTRGAEARA